MSWKNLEEKAVEIEIQGVVKKVTEINGLVKNVSGYNKPIKIKDHSIGSITRYLDFQTTGYQKELLIFSDSKISTDEIISLNFSFRGTSPVRGGDRIKVGLILDKDIEIIYRTRNILYLGILNQNGSLGRIDYEEGYTPLVNDIKKLGLD